MKTYQVQGQGATLNEYNVSLALDRMKIDYHFQFAPWGSYGVRGQYVVDFIVRIPLWTPVEVFGDYWHMGQLGADDKIRLAMISDYFHMDVIILWGRDTMTPEDALDTVRKEIRIAL